MYHLVGFDTTGSAKSMTATVAGAVATVASGTYCFRDLASVMGTGRYTAFGTAVKAAFDAATGTAFTVAFDTTTYRWTVSRATNFTLAFATDADLRLRAALGFTGNKSGTNTYTSDVRPYYVIVPDIDARSLDTDLFEPGRIVEEDVSDGGTSYAAARVTSELHRDWQHFGESKAATFSLSAVSAVPWTWQHFFGHVRGTHPFWASDEGHVYKLRADGAQFDRRTRDYVTFDDSSLWVVNLMTRYLGAA